MQLVIQQLNQYLKDGDLISLMKAEKAINFDVIFSTHSKPFCNITDEKKLLEYVMKLTQRFISVNFPDSSAVDIALQFAVDIVDMRPDWNILDVLYFFKFIRQRQDLPENKIFGNKISPIKLTELTAVYENNKSIAREIWHKNEISREVHGTKEDRLMIGTSAQKLIGSDETFKDTRFAEIAKKITDKEKEKSDKIYLNAAKTKQFLKDMEKHWDQQMDLVFNHKISEEQAIINHQKYRLEYKNE